MALRQSRPVAGSLDSAAAVLVPHVVLLFGGLQRNEAHGECFVMDLQSNVCRRVTRLDLDNVPTARSSHCMVPLADGRVLLCGGKPKNSAPRPRTMDFYIYEAGVFVCSPRALQVYLIQLYRSQLDRSQRSHDSRVR